MGKPTGFLEYHRQVSRSEKEKQRIRHFHEFHTPLTREKQQLQGARCMACGVPFCQSGMILGGMSSGCPLNNLIPEWNDLVYKGKWEEAYRRLAKTNSFPEFTARVCPALCEAACTCGLNYDPVAVKENEYGVIETAFEKGYIKAVPPKVRTGKKVAVVGSGPSGLAAADRLNRRGHLVTVFERNDRIGGLLRYGIPNMKLEKKIIDRRIALMEAEGIQFKTGVNVGIDYQAEQLLEEYDRVLLTCGASNPRDINVAGRDAKGIYFAVDFLTAVTKSLDNPKKMDALPVIKGKTVMVIGGGDTGNDCVGSSIRLGAAAVIQLEMMPKLPDSRTDSNPWPQWPRVCKTDYGQEEAIAVYGKDPRVYQTTVEEFIKDKEGRVCKARVVQLENKKDEKTGRMTISAISGSGKEVEVDVVLIAAGFLGTEKYLIDAFRTECNERSSIKTEKDSYQTSADRVFAAGDVRRGQSLVVWAIKEGREAAREVDQSLMGYTNL